METLDTEDIDKLWDETPMSPEEAKARRRGHQRKYNRDYYHEHKTLCVCEHCGTEFGCKSSLTKHQRRSKTCMINKMTKCIDELHNKLELCRSDK